MAAMSIAPASPLRIAVVGVGDIGSTFALQLSRIGGHDVTVIARSGSKRQEQLRRDGAIFESVFVPGVRRGGGASWKEALDLARGVHASFGLIKDLGYSVYPRGRALIDRALASMFATVLWSMIEAGLAALRGGGGLSARRVGVSATAVAYVRFALADPALFRLAFAHPQDAAARGGESHDKPTAMLRASAAAYAPEGVDPQVAALQAGSRTHGLALLMLDGHVAVEDAVIDAVVNPRNIGWRA